MTAPRTARRRKARSVRAALQALWELHADRRRWTQQVAARTARGQMCQAKSPRAVKWCLFGGVDHVTSGVYVQADVLDALQAQTDKLLTTLNDVDGYAAVRKVERAALIAAGGRA